MKRNKGKKGEDLIKKISEKEVFRKMFGRMLSEEKSDFGKLLLQENLIFNEIIILLSRINLYNRIVLENKYNNIEEDMETLKGCTLGQLIGTLRLFLSKNAYPFMGILNEYNTLRNKLTHKIFTGRYKSTSDLYIDAVVATRKGDGILDEIRKLQLEMVGKIAKGPEKPSI